MAGNPFRKSQFLPLDVGAAREAPAAAADPSLDTSQPAAAATTTTTTTNTQAKTKGKVQKKVRILSPVVSPDSPAPSYHEHGAFNSYFNPKREPAPAQDVDVARELPKSFLDSLATGATHPNTKAAIPLAPAPNKMETPVQPAQQAPYNPFARTLATIDPQNGSSALVGGSRDASAPSAKPAMDVDAFTRMLLTGNTPSASPGSLTPSSGHPTLDSSSLGDLHPESPAASDDELHHDPPAASDDELHHDPPELDHEHLTGLIGPPDTQAKKPKPPPPAHRHGKPLPTLRKGPQTVSFADFDVPGTPPALPSPKIASPKPELVGSPSDLNKPLPPPPPTHQSPSLASTPVALDQADGPAHSPHLAPGNFDLNLKKPPPPPTSRRSSQVKMPNSRPRSTSNLSRSSVLEDYTEGTTPPIKPPPPPARRVPHSVEKDLPIPSARPPPPPPSRHTKQRPPSVTRTSSTHSVASLNNRRVSPNTTQTPPLPPPRRGENKRPSLDGISAPSPRRMSETSRRSSGASLHSGGGAETPSVSSIPTVDEDYSSEERSFNATPQPEMTAGGAAAGVDILADMSAMQREIDALMAKSKGVAVGKQ